MTLNAYEDREKMMIMERFIDKYDDGKIVKKVLMDAELTVLNNQEKIHENINDL